MLDDSAMEAAQDCVLLPPTPAVADAAHAVYAPTTDACACNVYGERGEGSLSWGRGEGGAFLLDINVDALTLLSAE